jgi:hypothetical protein
MMVKKEICYFQNPGPENTVETITAAKKTVVETEINYVVVASGSGDTGVKVAETFRNSKVKVVVVNQDPGGVIFEEENRLKLLELNARIVTSMYAYAGPAESITATRYKGYWTENMIIKTVLRKFSQGTKVASEIVMMATDAGAIPAGEDVVAIAGTEKGADTALVIKSCHAFAFFDRKEGMEFREVIAMPRNKNGKASEEIAKKIKRRKPVPRYMRG